MRVRYRPDQIHAAFEHLTGPVLVDRFLESALEIDVDALSDGEETYVAAVMEHVEEAGIHSGDSSCVLPPHSLAPDHEREIRSVVERLAPALGVVGLINVQLAVAGGDVYVLEANPRASRTVPFASKAIGVNLVEAACRLTAGARITDLVLPRRRAGRPHRGPVSVKQPYSHSPASPAATPYSGPKCARPGSHGVRTRLPERIRESRARRRTPAPRRGHRLPRVSVRDEDKRALVPVAQALAILGFRLVATIGTARTLTAAGIDAQSVRKVDEAEPVGSPSVFDLIARGSCDLIVNTPKDDFTRRADLNSGGGNALQDSVRLTTLAAAAAAVEAIARARPDSPLSLQEATAARDAFAHELVMLRWSRKAGRDRRRTFVHAGATGQPRYGQ